MTTGIRANADIEAMVGYVLRNGMSITVASSMPKTPTFPVILVQRLGGSHPRKRALDWPNVQFDCYGNTKTEAFDTAADAHRTLLEMEGESYSNPVNIQIAEVSDTLGISWAPDPTTAKDRYIFSMAFVCHTT